MRNRCDYEKLIPLLSAGKNLLDLNLVSVTGLVLD